MFSLLQKLIGSLIVRFNFFNRSHSTSYQQKQSNSVGDNIGRDKITNVYVADVGEKMKTGSLIYLWGTDGQSQENQKILAYEFDFVLQNKGGEILKDIWVNFSSSGFNLELERTKQTQFFKGWDIYGQALQLVTIEDYKCPPQHFLIPFRVKILLKKELLPEQAWVYFSYGSPDVKKVEKEVRIRREDLKKFITSSDRSTEDFIQLLGLGKKRS